MLGLLELMARLAEQRTGGVLFDGLVAGELVFAGAVEREHADPDVYPASAEFWRIYDRIERGERP